MFMYVMREVEKHCAEDLATLGVTLDMPSLPFPRVTYTECVKMLNENGSTMQFGEDVGSEDERKLGKLVQEKYGNCAYFLTKWPAKVRAFYIMHEQKGELCHGFDFMYRGLELSSGGQREHRVDVLRQQIADNGMDPVNFEFYLQAFKYGMPTHGGFGIGVDRMVQMICQLENIRDAVLFPRDPERLVP
jgi:aspartyl-tRNA synthetase